MTIERDIEINGKKVMARRHGHNILVPSEKMEDLLKTISIGKYKYNLAPYFGWYDILEKDSRNKWTKWTKWWTYKPDDSCFKDKEFDKIYYRESHITENIFDFRAPFNQQYIRKNLFPYPIFGDINQVIGCLLDTKNKSLEEVSKECIKILRNYVPHSEDSSKKNEFFFSKEGMNAYFINKLKERKLDYRNSLLLERYQKYSGDLGFSIFFCIGCGLYSTAISVMRSIFESFVIASYIDKTCGKNTTFKEKIEKLNTRFKISDMVIEVFCDDRLEEVYGDKKKNIEGFYGKLCEYVHYTTEEYQKRENELMELNDLTKEYEKVIKDEISGKRLFSYNKEYLDVVLDIFSCLHRYVIEIMIQF